MARLRKSKAALAALAGIVGLVKLMQQTSPSLEEEPVFDILAEDTDGNDFHVNRERQPEENYITERSQNLVSSFEKVTVSQKKMTISEKIVEIRKKGVVVKRLTSEKLLTKLRTSLALEILDDNGMAKIPVSESFAPGQ